MVHADFESSRPPSSDMDGGWSVMHMARKSDTSNAAGTKAARSQGLRAGGVDAAATKRRQAGAEQATTSAEALRTPVPAHARPGRNEPCHCGSGQKYKHCCLEKDERSAAAARAKAAAEASAQSPEAVPSPPIRAPKHQTHQPWKAATSRGFVPRTRMPRKVGGS